ncbi:MAG: NAD(P)H-quinone oxidoreductase [Eubacteriales bacterium]|jgi:NADPH2:quinone reductase|nr:NAD(P)H-quinone oxidoreductase [Eubacteriales bacterium]MDD4743071.1 NAD(P)H-quinone oxidoreductase [Eubacteriales bacterium]
MKAILVDPAKNLVWSDVPDPVIKADEVLVDIHAAALNRADLLQRQGKYPPPPGWPEWMGLEVSGVIADIGPEAAQNSTWQIGDAVCALLGGGGYAQRVAVRYDLLMPIPRGLTFAEAAALPEAFATSYLNLFIEGHLQAGQTAFIPAGASGLASVAIPLAKAFGARVITSVLSEPIAASIRHLNADIVINSASEDPVAVLGREFVAGRPIHVAMDCLGGAALGQSLPFMAHGGTWILISTLAGTTTEVPLRDLLTKGIHLVGSMLRNRTPEMKARILSELVSRVWPKLESREIRPTIYRVLPIEKAQEAHALLEQSLNVGKVVLAVRG